MRDLRIRLDVIIILLSALLVGEAVSLDSLEALRDAIVQRFPVTRSAVLRFRKKGPDHDRDAPPHG